MQLSTTQFERIIRASANTDTAARPTIVPAGCKVAAERRSAARVSLGQRVQMRAVKKGVAGRWQTAVVRDVCVTGLSVRTDAKLVSGDLFVVRFQTGPGQHMCIESQVCWAEAGDAGHLVGATFTRLIEHQAYMVQSFDDQEVPVFIEQKPEAAAKPGRKKFGLADALFGVARVLSGRRTAGNLQQV